MQNQARVETILKIKELENKKKELENKRNSIYIADVLNGRACYDARQKHEDNNKRMSEEEIELAKQIKELQDRLDNDADRQYGLYVVYQSHVDVDVEAFENANPTFYNYFEEALVDIEERAEEYCIDGREIVRTLPNEVFIRGGDLGDGYIHINVVELIK